MALSGSFSASILSGHYKLRVDWSATQNVANNTSKITAVTYLVNDWSVSVGTRSDNSTTIAGAAQTWTSPAVSGTGTTKLGAVTSGDIAHNADGTKSVTISATYYIRATINGTYYEKITATADVVLDTIPRATTPTFHASTVDMSRTLTIYTYRASESFKHDLAYSFAGSAFQTFATDVGTWYAWAVPDLATSIPNATSGTMTIRCTTKDSKGNTVGTKTGLVTVKVPASVVPTIKSVTATEATSGLAAQFGAFIQGKSKIKTDIKADGAKGSSIKSYSTTFAGMTYTGNSWTSGLVTGSGTMNLVTTVTDSRGRTAEEKTSIEVLAYSTPKVYAFGGSRRNAAGEPDASGTRIAVRYNYEVNSLNGGNTAALVIEYKQSTATKWETLLTGSDLSADTTQVLASPTFSSDYQYDLRLTVTDYFGAFSVYTAVLPSGAVILDIKADGLGIAFGKTADKSGVDFGWSPKGAVLGLAAATQQVPSDATLAEYTTPGVYAVTANDIAETLTDAPLPYAGTMRVWISNGAEEEDTAWIYRTQEYHPYRVDYPAYRRTLQTDGEGVWSATAWERYGKLYTTENYSIAWKSDVRVANYTLSREGSVVCLSAQISVPSDITAGTTKVLGVIPEALRLANAVLTVGRQGNTALVAVAVRANGELIMTPCTAYPSTSSVMFTLTWNTSAAWK